MDNTKDKSKTNEYVAFVAIKIMLVFAVVIAAWLSKQAVTRSFFSSKNYNEPIFQMDDSAIVHIAFFVVICGTAFGFKKLLDKCKAYQEKISSVMLLVSCIWVVVIGCVFLWQHPYYPVGDQIKLITAAQLAIEGDYGALAPGGMLGLCPQNKGLMFFYELLSRVFGDKCYRVGAFMHIGYNLITLVSGYILIKDNIKSVFCRILYCLFIMFCVPIIILLPYNYGDLGAIAFCMLMFMAISKFEREFRWRYVCIACISSAFALLFRTHTWIALIAVAIGMVVVSISKKNIQPFLAALCIIIAAQGAVIGVSKMYEVRSGEEGVRGIPSILYIAMGLQETDRLPGIYNHYHQSVYMDNDMDIEASNKEGIRNIRESIEKFKNNPGYAKYFFKKKMRMQWTEPTFETFYATNTLPEDVRMPLWLNELYYGKSHDIVWKAANYYQSVVYLAMFALTVLMLTENLSELRINTFLIPMIAVVGGFLFSIIWENQSRYVLPYYLFLVMYTPIGLYGIVQLMEELSGRVFKRRNPGREETKEAA